MRTTSLLALLIAIASCGGGNNRREDLPPDDHGRPPDFRDEEKAPLHYPTTRKENVIDTYHGVEIEDPYRWLEDDNSEETAAWVQAQNAITFNYLEAIPERKGIIDRLTELWDYEKFGVPFEEGGRYFYSRNDGLQAQSVLYWTDDLSAPPKVLFDPNTLSADGTVALAGYSISEDGKHMAYGLQDAGSDWAHWHIRNIDSGEDLPERLDWIKFSGARWAKDGSGIYYGRYPKPQEGASMTEANFNQKVYFHRVGTAQDKDTVVFETPEHPKWSSDVVVSEDGRYLVASIGKGTGPVNQVHIKDLQARGTKAKWLPIIDTFEAMYSFVGNQGPIFWFVTDKDAPRARVIAIDIRRPAAKNWQEIVPQQEATLLDATLVGKHLVTEYLKDAYSVVLVRDLTGKEVRKVEMPGIGSAGGFSGDTKSSETFYSFSSFTTPPTVYRYDVSTGKSEVFKQAKVDIDPSHFVVKQEFYVSKDGTRVPMFLVHKKGVVLDGQNPTFLYGYGGFNIPLTPDFSVSRLAWVELGGVLAIANLRGGGEYGEEWHQAGTKLQKQNVFDDFIAAAEWLIANNYTSPPKLAIHGRSNGGLLVGAAMTQRPDLFGAALPGVGVLDMLRFHKFTIGWAWIDDYGSSDDPEEFKTLRSYSPYHNLKPVNYPATLITTADHDDRVVPAHSFKFAARLQELHTGEAPVLIRIETKAGHGAGKPTKKRIEEVADSYAFLVEALHMR